MAGGEATWPVIRDPCSVGGESSAPLQLVVDKGRVSNWEQTRYTPAVFVRVANKGLRAYGTWKNLRKIVGPVCLGVTFRVNSRLEGGNRRGPLPWVFA